MTALRHLALHPKDEKWLTLPRIKQHFLCCALWMPLPLWGRRGACRRCLLSHFLPTTSLKPLQLRRLLEERLKQSHTQREKQRHAEHLPGDSCPCSIPTRQRRKKPNPSISLKISWNPPTPLNPQRLPDWVAALCAFTSAVGSASCLERGWLCLA